MLLSSNITAASEAKYRIAGKFGGELYESAKISYSHIILYIWRSRTEPPNLIPANISGYTVLILTLVKRSIESLYHRVKVDLYTHTCRQPLKG